MNGIEIWVDGGRAVDALLGLQNRHYKDLDVVLNDHDVGRLREVLAEAGFRELEGGRPFNFVLADLPGREVDVPS